MSEFPKLTKNIEFLHISRQRIFKNSLTRPCTHVFAQDNTVEKEPFKPQQELNRRTVSSHPSPVPGQVQVVNATSG